MKLKQICYSSKINQEKSEGFRIVITYLKVEPTWLIFFAQQSLPFSSEFWKDVAFKINEFRVGLRLGYILLQDNNFKPGISRDL